MRCCSISYPINYNLTFGNFTSKCIYTYWFTIFRLSHSTNSTNYLLPTKYPIIKLITSLSIKSKQIHYHLFIANILQTFGMFPLQSPFINIISKEKTISIHNFIGFPLFFFFTFPSNILNSFLFP